MADAIVGVIDQSGAGVKKVETSELTRADGTIVERERVAIGDPANINNLAGVNGGALSVDDSGNSVLREILSELRGIKFVLMGLADNATVHDLDIE